MSGFIDKLSNKIQGNDDKSQKQYQTEEDSALRGNTRAGQQSQGNRDQQFSTGSNQQGSTLGSTQGHHQGHHHQTGRDDTFGDSGLARDHQQTSAVGTGVGGNDVEDWGDDSNLTSGSRQTRSQGGRTTQSGQTSQLGQQTQGQGLGQGQSAQGGQFSRQAEEVGRKGFDKGYEEGQKYVNRNL